MPYFAMPRGGKRFGAGRKKGSVGSLSTEIREQMFRRNFDPLERLIDLCEDERLDLFQRAKILMDLCQYAYPKIKPIDLTALPQEPITVKILNLSEKNRASLLDEDLG